MITQATHLQDAQDLTVIEMDHPDRSTRRRSGMTDLGDIRSGTTP
jgi:hypothetical protein